MNKALKIQNASTLEYGNTRISYTVRRSDRQRLRIDVHPDLRVVVIAPQEKSIEDIEERVRKRASWIARQQRQFEKFQPLPLPRKYISGETHFYLGRQYRLRIRSSRMDDVKLKSGYFFIKTRGDCKDPTVIESLLSSWLTAHAKIQFTKRSDALWKKIQRYGIKKPDINIRLMKKRWGSCTKSGKIILNVELIKAPVHCIDYVIMHEFCHLLVPKHNNEFYTLLSRCMPDWKRRKQRLDMVLL